MVTVSHLYYVSRDSNNWIATLTLGTQSALHFWKMTKYSKKDDDGKLINWLKFYLIILYLKEH